MAEGSRIDRECCRDCARRFCLGLPFLHKMFAISIREPLSEQGCQGMRPILGTSRLGVSEEVAETCARLTCSLFASDILRRMLPPVSRAKPTSAPLQF
jgi:hypothetical protein